MSRLDEECIMAVVRNRSGMDAGEIDYEVSVDKFHNMDLEELREALDMLNTLKQECLTRIETLSKG